jgi:RHS repeat-associated protein
VQNLHYTYDPAGNITHIQDEAQDSVYFNGQLVEPSNDYTYDSLNRLIEATGREQDVVGPPVVREGPWQGSSIPSGSQLRNYIQRYQYDAVGNFVEMAHLAGAGSWTRHYANHSDSNRLHQTWVGNGASNTTTYSYDAHGSMLNLNRVEQPRDADSDWGLHLKWDWRDMISGIDLGGGGNANYQYGIDKQLTRKQITRNAAAGGTFTEDRIYLGGMELYRRRNAQGDVVEEIESIHLFEGEQRVLMVDDVISTDGARPDGLSVSARTLMRYQYSNHLGSAGLELDHAAQIISYEEFHPFGTSALRLMDASKEAPTKRYRYTGMERDEESGLNYHAARFQTSWLGRWLSCDPLGLVDGTNLYCYVRCNPLRTVDTTGKEGEVVVLGRWDQSGRWTDFWPSSNSERDPMAVQWAQSFLKADAAAKTGLRPILLTETQGWDSGWIQIDKLQAKPNGQFGGLTSGAAVQGVFQKGGAIYFDTTKVDVFGRGQTPGELRSVLANLKVGNNENVDFHFFEDGKLSTIKRGTSQVEGSPLPARIADRIPNIAPPASSSTSTQPSNVAVSSGPPMASGSWINPAFSGKDRLTNAGEQLPFVRETQALLGGGAQLAAKGGFATLTGMFVSTIEAVPVVAAAGAGGVVAGHSVRASAKAAGFGDKTAKTMGFAAAVGTGAYLGTFVGGPVGTFVGAGLGALVGGGLYLMSL